MNTYVITENGVVNLNDRLSYKLNDVSYTFEDESSDDDKEIIKEGSEIKSEKYSGIRTRRKDKKDKEIECEKKRQPKQAKLRKNKIEEIRNRFETGNLVIEKKSEIVDLTTICCYKHEDEMEKELKRKV